MKYKKESRAKYRCSTVNPELKQQQG